MEIGTFQPQLYLDTWSLTEYGWVTTRQSGCSRPLTKKYLALLCLWVSVSVQSSGADLRRMSQWRDPCGFSARGMTPAPQFAYHETSTANFPAAGDSGARQMDDHGGSQRYSSRQ